MKANLLLNYFIDYVLRPCVISTGCGLACKNFVVRADRDNMAFSRFNAPGRRMAVIRTRLVMTQLYLH